MRLGILGGTFDPVHYGHLVLAEYCREECGLDQVWFLPAAITPHKQGDVVASSQARVEMLQLAIGGHPSLAVSTLEIERGGISYTVDTLAQLKAEVAARELFLLLGSDTLEAFAGRRDARRICELSTIVAATRPGAADPDFSVLSAGLGPEAARRILARRVNIPPLGISSSDLRRRVHSQRSIRYLTPRAVEQYIASAGLYR